MSTGERHHIPEPTLERLVVLYGSVCNLLNDGVATASSGELAGLSMTTAYNVRKDLNHLPSSCGNGSGYDLERLKAILQRSLGFSALVQTCIVGLGDIGSALLGNSGIFDEGYQIAAGFDSNVNKLELMKSTVPLFPTHEIEHRVRDLEIELAVIAVPQETAQQTADRLVKGGISGIVNFTQVILSDIPQSVRVRNISVLHEFRVLTALGKSNE